MVCILLSRLFYYTVNYLTGDLVTNMWEPTDEEWIKADVVTGRIASMYSFIKTKDYKRNEGFEYYDKIPETEVDVGYLPIYFNISSTEFSLQRVDIGEDKYLGIFICGSNDWMDWFWNFNLISWDGHKAGNLLAGNRITKVMDLVKQKDLPLIIGTHSKSGGTGWVLAETLPNKFSIDSIYAFAPAPSLRKEMSLSWGRMFIDPDDIVHNAGGLTFNHPDVLTYIGVDDPACIDLEQHMIEFWNKLTNLKVLEIYNK